MRTISIALVLLIVGLSLPYRVTEGKGLTENVKSQIRRVKNPIADHYIVVFKDGVGADKSAAENLAQTHGGSIRFHYERVFKGFSARLSEQAARALSNNPLVAFVEQDGEVELSGVQVAPQNWGLDRIDQRDLPLDGLYSYPGLGSNVNAYVIDSGITYSHPEFGGRAVFGTDKVEDGLFPAGADCAGHGTSVAGILGGATYGVAKQVTLYSVRVGKCTGLADRSALLAGMDWVSLYHKKPAVANISINAHCNTIAECQQLSVVDIATEALIASGVTVVVSAGNTETPVNSSPARVASAITVGAITNTDRRVGGTAYGEYVDLFAPGYEIVTATKYGGTTLFSYTSAAAPHVAGAAALYLQTHPAATPAQVQLYIVNTASFGKVRNIPSFTGTPNRLLYIQPA